MREKATEKERDRAREIDIETEGGRVREKGGESAHE